MKITSKERIDKEQLALLREREKRWIAIMDILSGANVNDYMKSYPEIKQILEMKEELSKGNKKWTAIWKSKKRKDS